MNDDRVIGAGKELLGKGERTLGDTIGDERLQGDGVVDQVAGAVQHGYGKAKDTISDVMDDAPGAIASVVDRTRQFGRQADEAVRERLGDNGPLYLIGGAVALFALGAFALARSTHAKAPKPRHSPKRRTVKATPKSATSKG